jgi:hypothetical protein
LGFKKPAVVAPNAQAPSDTQLAKSRRRRGSSDVPKSESDENAMTVHAQIKPRLRISHIRGSFGIYHLPAVHSLVWQAVYQSTRIWKRGLTYLKCQYSICLQNRWSVRKIN